MFRTVQHGRGAGMFWEVQKRSGGVRDEAGWFGNDKEERQESKRSKKVSRSHQGSKGAGARGRRSVHQDTRLFRECAPGYETVQERPQVFGSVQDLLKGFRKVHKSGPFGDVQTVQIRSTRFESVQNVSEEICTNFDASGAWFTLVRKGLRTSWGVMGVLGVLEVPRGFEAFGRARGGFRRFHSVREVQMCSKRSGGFQCFWERAGASWGVQKGSKRFKLGVRRRERRKWVRDVAGGRKRVQKRAQVCKKVHEGATQRKKPQMLHKGAAANKKVQDSAGGCGKWR